jgi:hypothetical protein
VFVSPLTECTDEIQAVRKGDPSTVPGLGESRYGLRSSENRTLALARCHHVLEMADGAQVGIQGEEPVFAMKAPPDFLTCQEGVEAAKDENDEGHPTSSASPGGCRRAGSH